MRATPAVPTYPYVVYSTPDGGVAERRDLRALDYHGALLTCDDLIPLPEGATLSMLPDRLAVGMDAPDRRTPVPSRAGWALAALLPTPYTPTPPPPYQNT